MDVHLIPQANQMPGHSVAFAHAQSWQVPVQEAVDAMHRVAFREVLVVFIKMGGLVHGKLKHAVYGGAWPTTVRKCKMSSFGVCTIG